MALGVGLCSEARAVLRSSHSTGTAAAGSQRGQQPTSLGRLSAENAAQMFRWVLLRF